MTVTGCHRVSQATTKIEVEEKVHSRRENAVSEGGVTGVTSDTGSYIPQNKNLFSKWKSAAHGRYKESPGPPGPLGPESAILGQKRRLGEITHSSPSVIIGPFLPEPEMNPAVAVAHDRWSLEDERECSSRCKRCGGPIQWGKIIEDTADPDAVGRWMPLGPDLMPHSPCGGANAGRVPKVEASAA